MSTTPRPWREGKPTDSIITDGETPSRYDAAGVTAYYGGRLVAESIQPDDRPLILRAVNAFDDLLAVAKAADRADRTGSLAYLVDALTQLDAQHQDWRKWTP